MQVYHTQRTRCDVDAPLRLSHLPTLTAWFNPQTQPLRQYADAHADDTPSTITLLAKSALTSVGNGGLPSGASLAETPGRPDPTSAY
jgi:hypothetical protein